MADPLFAGQAKHVLNRIEQILHMPCSGADAAASALAKELRFSKVPKPLLNKATKMARHMGIASNLERHFTALGSAKWLESFDAAMDSIDLAMQPKPTPPLHSVVSGFALPSTESEEIVSPGGLSDAESNGASSTNTTYVEEEPDQLLFWSLGDSSSALQAGSLGGSPPSQQLKPVSPRASEASGSKDKKGNTSPLVPAGLPAMLAQGQAEVEWDPNLSVLTDDSESDLDEDAYTNSGYSEASSSAHDLPSSKPSSSPSSDSEQADKCTFLSVKDVRCLANTSRTAYDNYFPIVAKYIDKKCAASHRLDPIPDPTSFEPVGSNNATLQVNASAPNKLLEVTQTRWTVIDGVWQKVQVLRSTGTGPHHPNMPPHSSGK